MSSNDRDYCIVATAYFVPCLYKDKNCVFIFDASSSRVKREDNYMKVPNTLNV